MVVFWSVSTSHLPANPRLHADIRKLIKIEVPHHLAPPRFVASTWLRELGCNGPSMGPWSHGPKGPPKDIIKDKMERCEKYIEVFRLF